MMLYKVTAGNFKDIDSKQGIVVSYPSSFGVLDDGNDIVDKGAFKRTINAWGPKGKRRIKAMYQHEPAWLVGKPVDMKEDDFGLLVTTQFSIRNSFAKDILVLIEDEVITEQSIGYDIVRKYMDDDNHRHLAELKLYEYSYVTWGMNEVTPIVGVKSPEESYNRLVKSMERFEKALRNGRFESDEVPEMIETAIRRWKDEAKELEATIWEDEEGRTTQIRITDPVCGNKPEEGDDPDEAKPFGPYADFEECVVANADRENPEAFCAWLHRQITGEWPGGKQMGDWLFENEKTITLSQKQVEELCPSCAEKMKEKNLKQLKLSRATLKGTSEELIEALTEEKVGVTLKRFQKDDFVQTFNQVRLQEDMWRMRWEMFDALHISLESIFESSLTPQEKMSLVNVTLNQFHEAMLSWAQRMVELIEETQFEPAEAVTMIASNQVQEIQKAIVDLKNRFNDMVEKEEKEGRVLSNSNRRLVEQAIEALQALLDEATRTEAEKDNNVIINVVKEDRTIWTCPHCSDEIREKSIFYEDGKWYHCCKESSESGNPITLPDAEEDSQLFSDVRALLDEKDSKKFTPSRKDSPSSNDDPDSVHSSDAFEEVEELLKTIRGLGDYAEEQKILHELRGFGETIRKGE